MYTDATPPITSAAEVLEGASGVREQLRLLDRGIVLLAVEWAKHNPGEPLPPEHPGFEGMEDQWIFDQLHGKGCLAFDDSTVPEFALAAGLTEYSARKLIRESLMLVHLLPRVWARVLAGGLEVWRARNLANDCFELPIEAIEYIDRHMSERTARVTVTSRERILDEVHKIFLPEGEQSAEEEAKASRDVAIYPHEVDHGTVPMWGVLDVPDALALEAALTTGAQALKDAGSDAPLGTRRAWALGDLARAATGQSTLFDGGGPCCHSPGSPATGSAPTSSGEPGDPAVPSDPGRPHWSGGGVQRPTVKLFIHLPSSTFFNEPPPAPDTAGPPPGTGPPARTTPGEFGVVQGTGLRREHLFTPGIIREWFTRPTLAGAFSPVIKMRPVIDLGNPEGGNAYQPPERAREHVHLTHGGCVFPFCTRPAYRCDIDHTTPWEPDGSGGATCTCNLAPLCRTHHRLKTHADNAPVTSGEHSRWSYVHLGEEEYFWTGPRGMQFIRSNMGTYNAGTHRNDGAPQHPGAAQTAAAQAHLLVGDDELRDATENLADRLLTKAALTRGVHNRDYSPMWSVPARKASDDPPEDYPLDDDDPGGSLMFYIPFTPSSNPFDNGGRSPRGDAPAKGGVAA